MPHLTCWFADPRSRARVSCTQARRPVNATDIIPVWDKAVERLGDKAVIVYPQSTGDPGKGDLAVEGDGDKYRQVCVWCQCVDVCASHTRCVSSWLFNAFLLLYALLVKIKFLMACYPGLNRIAGCINCRIFLKHC